MKLPALRSRAAARRTATGRAARPRPGERLRMPRPTRSAGGASSRTRAEARLAAARVLPLVLDHQDRARRRAGHRGAGLVAEDPRGPDRDEPADQGRDASPLRGPRTILDDMDERKGAPRRSTSRRCSSATTRIDLIGPMLNPELPRSLKIVRFDPPSFTLRVDRRMMKRLPVKADLAGSPALGYTVAESSVTPELGRGDAAPHSLLQELKQVSHRADRPAAAWPSCRARNVLLERDRPLDHVRPRRGPRAGRPRGEPRDRASSPKVPIVMPSGVTRIVPAGGRPDGARAAAPAAQPDARTPRQLQVDVERARRRARTRCRSR